MNLNSSKNYSEVINKYSVFDKVINFFKTKMHIADIKVGESEDANDIIEKVKTAKNELLNTYNNFENVKDDLMVDYYVYRIKACEARYDYLIKIAKVKGIKTWTK